MRRLPAFLQPFLTWLSGKPLAGARSWNLRPVHHLIACLVPAVAGTAVSVLAVLRGGWLLLVLPVGWLLTTHGIRKLRTMILHQCSHRNFWRRPRTDRLVGKTIGILLLSQEYDEYQREHIGDHHSNGHMTMRDPTVQFLILTMGARGGMERSEIWRRLRRTLVSPSYHAKATWGRIRSHYTDTSVAYRVAFTGVTALEIVGVTLTHSWVAFSVAWLVPLIILFNMSALLRLSSRHIFPAPGVRRLNRDSMAAYTHGIFIGEAAPVLGAASLAGLAAWARWWGRMLLLHLPSRLFVLVGDGPCHDYHHRHPRSKDWSNYISARAADIEAGHPGWPAYTEVWGLGNAIDSTFTSLSEADPDYYRRSPGSTLSSAALVAAIEE
jgi:fatty acid desaturase